MRGREYGGEGRFERWEMRGRQHGEEGRFEMRGRQHGEEGRFERWEAGRGAAEKVRMVR